MSQLPSFRPVQVSTLFLALNQADIQRDGLYIPEEVGRAPFQTANADVSAALRAIGSRFSALGNTPQLLNTPDIKDLRVRYGLSTGDEISAAVVEPALNQKRLQDLAALDGDATTLSMQDISRFDRGQGPVSMPAYPGASGTNGLMRLLRQLLQQLLQRRRAV